jgi:anti-sigma factor RsiW
VTDPRDPRDSLLRLPAADPRDAAARATRHQVLRDLLAGYADGELPPETASQIDAHLVGCEPCRAELAVHEVVRRRLAAEPAPAAAPDALRRRVLSAVAALPEPAPASAAPPRAPRRRRAAVVTALALATLAGAAGVRTLARGGASDAPDARVRTLGARPTRCRWCATSSPTTRA